MGDIEELKKYFGQTIEVNLEENISVEMQPLTVADLPKLFKIGSKLSKTGNIIDLQEEDAKMMIELIRASLKEEYRDPSIFNGLMSKYFFILFEKMMEMNNLGTTKLQAVKARLKAKEDVNAKKTVEVGG